MGSLGWDGVGLKHKHIVYRYMALCVERGRFFGDGGFARRHLLPTPTDAASVGAGNKRNVTCIIVSLKLSSRGHVCDFWGIGEA